MNKTMQLGIAALLLGIAAIFYLLHINSTITTICIALGSYFTARALFPRPPK